MHGTKSIVLIALMFSSFVIVAGPGEPKLSLDEPIHFVAPGGNGVQAPAGIYRVDADSGHLRLFPGTQMDKKTAKLIAASPVQHQRKLTTPVIGIVPDKKNPSLRHLVLLFPDGTGFEAIGTVSKKESESLSRPGYFEGHLLTAGDLAAVGETAKPRTQREDD